MVTTSKAGSDKKIAVGQNSDEADNDEETPLIRNHGNGKILRKCTKTQLFLCLCILATEMCERLTFYGMAANLVPYCKDVLKLQAPLPSQITLLFLGSCFFLPILGGWLADTYLGRFNVIYGFSLIYFVGCCVLTVSSYDYGKHGLTESLSWRTVNFAISLILIAFGTGGIKANVSPFGADQIRRAGEAAVTRYFNWFFWFINAGSLISFTLVVYVQQQISFFCGYLICALSMLLAISILLVGRNHYLTEPPEGSILSRTINIFWQGLKIKCCRSKTNKDGTWLDQTKISTGGNFSDSDVEDAKRLLPIISLFLSFSTFSVILGQYSTSFLRQGISMKLSIGSFVVPAASLVVVGIMTVIIFIPVLDFVVCPALNFCGLKITQLRKIGIGMVMGAAAMAVAAVVEIERKRYILEYGTFYQMPFNKPINASSMSILYQAPQFVFLGMGDILVNIPALEFAYSQSPKRLRGVVMGLCLAMNGIGFFMADALVSVVSLLAADWYPENLNSGSLENYFFLLMGIMLINLVVFLILAVRYNYVATDSDGIGDEFEDIIHEH